MSGRRRCRSTRDHGRRLRATCTAKNAGDEEEGELDGLAPVSIEARAAEQRYNRLHLSSFFGMRTAVRRRAPQAFAGRKIMKMNLARKKQRVVIRAEMRDVGRGELGEEILTALDELASIIGLGAAPTPVRQNGDGRRGAGQGIRLTRPEDRVPIARTPSRGRRARRCPCQERQTEVPWRCRRRATADRR